MPKSEAREAGDGAPDQDIRYDGASDGYDQELTEVKRPQNPELVGGVEDDGDEEDAADVFDCGANKPLPLGRISEKGPQDNRTPFTRVPQIGTDGEDGDHGRHDEQAEVQGAAEAAE